MIAFVLCAAVLYNCFQNVLLDELLNQETENIPQARVENPSFVPPLTKEAMKIFEEMHDFGNGLFGEIKKGAQNIGRFLPFHRR
ncbi:unnamed protein product [Parnassius apollo]|uniref:(apollo) hypothetical protein n=1 Tax=Parnassius apollo TaxID=110799 RepID=A0A8S3Y5B6_PARAO|nr:unnamed protein product [Parnassius apollo]